MPNKTISPDKTCSSPDTSAFFNEAMKLIGDFWTLRIIDALHDNELRFCEIERSIPDLNPATLSNRLKKLEEAKVIDRHKETVDKQSVTYSLSVKGHDMLPILSAIKKFTDKHK